MEKSNIFVASAIHLRVPRSRSKYYDGPGHYGALTEGKPMKVVRTLSICTLLLSLVTAAFALNPDRDIHQLAHRSWGEGDGYPGRAQALAQATDGFLWIGSDIGLFRFDGVHFERYVPSSGDQLPEDRVHSLLALPDGSLWIAYGTFGNGNKICFLRNGNVKCYGKADGVSSIPQAIVHDREGTIWANTNTGVIRFNGTRWEHIGKDWNFPEDVPRATSTALFVDSRGTLWAGVNHTVLYLKQGSKRFEPTGTFAGYSTSIAEAPDGTIWLADSNSYVRAISTSVSAKSAAMIKCEIEAPVGTPPKCPSEDPLVVKVRTVNDLIFDRNGSLWTTTNRFGLGRVPHPERLRNQPISKNSDALQEFASKDGLSADNCNPILEDRERNIWVATRDGLDQFRDTPLVPAALPTSIFQITIAPADGGDLWVAGSFNFVTRIHGGSGAVSLVPSGAFKPYRDPAGVTWIMGNSLGQWKDGKFRTVAQSPDGLSGSFGAWQVAGDKLGTLWAFSQGYGFFSLDHHRWKAWPTPPEVAKQRVADMFSDSTGLIWVSTYEGDIITMDKGNIVDYPVKPDSPLRYVRAFAEHAPHEIWAGGAGGLVLIDRGRFRVIRPAALDSLEDVTGIVDAGNEGLWLNTAGGVIHVTRGEADRALQDPSYRFQGERFDSFDGLPGQTQAIDPFPKAIQGTDGRIWFVATRGVAWVDPKDIPRNALPPPVSITSVSADGSRYPRLADLRLPAHTANVQIDYSALSLSVPERVRFRYNLDGIDKGWQDVDTRRQAYYSNLGPGSYRFQVIACNNDGVWNEAGAILIFSIAPAWFQTIWFRILCVAAFLGFLWTLHQFRIWKLRQREQKLQEVIATIPTFAWTASPDGSVDFLNRHYEDYTGVPVEKAVGSCWPAVVHREDLEHHVEKFRLAMATGELFEVESRFRRADGEYRWFLTRAVPRRDARGKIARWYGTSLEIEDRKRVEKLQEDLAHITRVSTMGELTASLAHEIKQPIGAAVTNAEACLRLLDRNRPDLPEAREAALEMTKDARRAADIIDHVRSLYQKDRPQLKLVDVNEVIAEMLVMLRNQANHHSVTMRTDLAEGLPTVMADRVQLQQVLMNLMLNGIEAMKDTGGDLSIRSQLSEDSKLLISVTDNGVGLPAGRADEIFNAFFTTKSQGTGLGLAITRSILESHGGRVWATAHIGGGTVFYFTLPIRTTVSA
jgi:PAS domain S-box-containing protein